MAGNPKTAKFLYSGTTGGEKGPNVVDLSLSEIFTIVSKDVIREHTAYLLECAEKNVMMDPKKIHPFAALPYPEIPLSFFLPVDYPAKEFHKKYPFVSPYVKRHKYRILGATPSFPPPSQEKNKQKTKLFSEICKFKVTEQQFQALVELAKKDGIIIIDDRKKD